MRKQSYLWLAVLLFSATAWCIALMTSGYSIRFSIPAINYLYFALVCAAFPISIFFVARNLNRRLTRWCGYIAAFCFALPALPASAFALVQTARYASAAQPTQMIGEEAKLIKRLDCSGETFAVYLQTVLFISADDTFQLKKETLLPFGLVLSKHLFSTMATVPDHAIELKCVERSLIYQEHSNTLYSYDLDAAR